MFYWTQTVVRTILFGITIFLRGSILASAICGYDPLLQKCCSLIESPDRLQRCVLSNNYYNGDDNVTKTPSESSTIRPERISVHLVTYASSDITGYSAYSSGINAAYAASRGYSYTILDEKTFNAGKLKLNTTDSRWFKVAILSQVLAAVRRIPTSNYSNHDTEYVVWVDADLSVINFELDIAELGATHPNADIFMSQDIAKAPFVSNSGMVVVRSSDWAERFLKLWWSSYDRNRCCDQNAFTWLYDRNYPADIREKVALLPVNAINTDFPCWKTQTRESRVLHLAGLTSLYRVPVFRRGFEHLCHQNRSMTLDNTSRKHQLGLTRNRLLNTLQQLNSYRLKALQRLLASMSSFQEDNDEEEASMSSYYNSSDRHFQRDSAVLHLNRVSSAVGLYRSRLLDYLKFDDDERENPWMQSSGLLLGIIRNLEVEIRQRMFAQLHLALLAVLRSSANESANVYSRDNMYPLFDCVVELVSNGFEIVIAIQDNGLLERDHVVDGIFEVIDAVISLTAARFRLPAKVRVRLLYYQFKLWQLRAGPAQSKSIHTASQAILYLEHAERYWQEMASYGFYGTSYVQADPYKEISEVVSSLATLHCMNGSHSLGLAAFQRSVLMQETTIRGYDSIRIATTDIVDKAKITLVETINNYCICGLEHMSRRVTDGEEQELALELTGHITHARQLLQTLQYPQEHIDWSQSLLAKLHYLHEKILASLANDKAVEKPNPTIRTNNNSANRREDSLSLKKAKKVLRVKKKSKPFST